MNSLKYFFVSLIPFKNIRHKLKQYIQIKKISQSLIDIANKETIFVIGDSHTDIFNKNTFENKYQIYGDLKDKHNMLFVNISNAPEFITFHLGPCLAFTTNSNNSSFKAKKKTMFLIDNGLLPQNVCIMCVFGEIDCRVHIKKQAEKNSKTEQEIIDNVIHNYGEYLLWLRNMGYKVIAYGPVSSQKDSCKLDPEFPRYGTEKERNNITKCFNKKLKTFCDNNGMYYMSIFDNIVNTNNTTKGAFFRDGVHLKLKAYDFLKKEKGFLFGIINKNKI